MELPNDLTTPMVSRSPKNKKVKRKHKKFSNLLSPDSEIASSSASLILTTPQKTSSLPVSFHLGLAQKNQSLMDLLTDHAEYSNIWSDVHEQLLYDQDLALKPSHRIYVAIMAASRHRCSSIVKELTTQFERENQRNGLHKWLNGLDHASQQMQALDVANTILAHRPWMFDQDSVKTLLDAGMSLEEITHALIIMCHYHAMASLVHAFGLEATLGSPPPSPSRPPALNVRQSSEADPQSHELSAGGVPVLVKRMQGLSPNPQVQVPTGCSSWNDPGCSTWSSPSRRDHCTLAYGSAGDSLFRSGADQMPTIEEACEASEDNEEEAYLRRFSIFSNDLDFVYEDFYGKGRKSEYHTLKYDQIWDDIGYLVVDKFTSGTLAELMDKKFQIAFNMTYNTCGHLSNVNTAPFRTAIWFYTQGLYGVKRDYYDYHNVNELLDVPLKTFLKLLCVAPHRFQAPDGKSGGLLDSLRPSERIHVAILAAEARLQAAMVYATNAVEKYYMTR